MIEIVIACRIQRLQAPQRPARGQAGRALQDDHVAVQPVQRQPPEDGETRSLGRLQRGRGGCEGGELAAHDRFTARAPLELLRISTQEFGEQSPAGRGQAPGRIFRPEGEIAVEFPEQFIRGQRGRHARQLDLGVHGGACQQHHEHGCGACRSRAQRPAGPAAPGGLAPPMEENAAHVRYYV